MNLEELMLYSEAIIFAADRPVNHDEIATVLQETKNVEEDSLEKLPAALEAIVEKYTAGFYPFEVKMSGGGYQFLSKSNFHPLIAKLNGTKFRKRLSAAAMETLAIIAYRQPTTKSEMEYIRGVNADYSVQKLLDLELIVILGRKEEAVGKPLLYGTSHTFMDYLGINSIEELPQLKEINQYEDIIPTDASEALPEAGESKMVVDENGEISEIELDEEELTEDADKNTGESESNEESGNETSENDEPSENENPSQEEKDSEDEDLHQDD
jgi:segregation and condensation protein B